MNSISLLTPTGHSLAVTASGSGPALMLLHGFPLNHRMWLSQLAELSQHFHVIAPDFRGFGQSLLGDTDYSLPDLADDVEFVRTRLASDAPFVLCGLSMGGYVAFEYWRRYGQHLAGWILTNTKPQADDDAARSARVKMAEVAVEKDAWTAVHPMIAKLLVDADVEANPIAHDVHGMLRNCTADAVAASQRAMARRADFTEHLSSMRLPTLVLTGEHDAIAPPQATRDWSAQIPSAVFDIVPGTAHLPPLENPQFFNNAVLDFLRDTLGLL